MEKEKKTIKCSYAVLVIILFAALAFVTDYAIIERKMNKCNCPKCEAITNNGEKIYDYKDVAGVYKASQGEYSYTLILSDDGLFRYSYGAGWGIVNYGNYFIKNNNIYLNDLFHTASDPSVVIQNDIYELQIGDGHSIIDMTSIAKKSTNVDSINFVYFDDESYNIRDDYQYLLQDKVVNMMKSASEHCDNN